MKKKKKSSMKCFGCLALFCSLVPTEDRLVEAFGGAGTRINWRKPSLLYSSRAQSIDRDEGTRQALIKAAMNLEITENLELVQFVGVTELARSQQRSWFDGLSETLPCAVLAGSSCTGDAATPCLFLPLESSNRQLTLLKAAKSRKPVSKGRLLLWNSLAVNRDGGLFDNLPYSTWTIDPDGRNRDAAGKPILEKFHLGKRDAYNRLMGKDWRFDDNESDDDSATNPSSRERPSLFSLLGRVASGSKAETEVEKDSDGTDELFTGGDTLARRMLELRLRELQMDLAECDYELAIARNGNGLNEISEIESRREDLSSQLQDATNRLGKLVGSSAPVDDQASPSDDDSVEAPYPGAIGYAPLKNYKGTMEYTNPYDMFRDIIRDQMKAEVIGCILENTSLLEGTLTLGGALLLRRLEATKEVSVLGESLSISDELETYGSEGVTGGAVFVVDCDADEAIGVSLAYDLPLQIEENPWKRGSVMAALAANSSIDDLLPRWEPLDPELSVLTEGEPGNQSSTERVSPIRIPLSTNNLFAELVRPKLPNTPSEMFPTDNPIKSLSEYDELKNEDKARTLISLSSFEGKLPRPRILKKSIAGEPNALDELLLPLVDESVRHQYKIRDAKERGDEEMVFTLENSKSKRRIAQEEADKARESGVEDEAARWDSEAAFLESLRADPTQDEGAYSRFLDRDDWYERTRQMQAKKIDRRKFGNLLDGVE